jgi:DNA-binding transcriptional MerR regulator
VESVRRIAVIKRAQELGFTLDEVSELLACRVDSRTKCETVEARAAGAIARIAEDAHAKQYKRPWPQFDVERFADSVRAAVSR